MPTDDIAEMLRLLGLRVSRQALLALIAHATTARLSPMQTFEEPGALARKERDHRNLAARTKAAAIGNFKPSTALTGTTLEPSRARSSMTSARSASSPRHNALLRGPSGVGKTMLAQNFGVLAPSRATPYASPRSPRRPRGPPQAGVLARLRAAPAQVHRPRS